MEREGHSQGFYLVSSHPRLWKGHHAVRWGLDRLSRDAPICRLQARRTLGGNPGVANSLPLAVPHCILLILESRIWQDAR